VRLAEWHSTFSIEIEDIEMPNDLELNDDGTPKEPIKIQFTAEQQDHITNVINARFAKMQEKHQREKDDLEKQIREAREAREATLANAGKPDLNQDGSPKLKPEEAAKEEFRLLLENEKNKARLAEEAKKRAEKEAEEAKGEALNVRKTQAMLNAASKQSFYQPDDVLNLVQNKIVWDVDSKTFVVKENGIIKQNSSLQNMTLDEFFAEVAASRPYLVNGDMKSGAGSKESSMSTNAGLIKTKLDLKTAKEKSDFIGKFGLDKFSALPPR
jgi:hypothetical protein